MLEEAREEGAKPTAARSQGLRRHEGMCAAIEDFWLDPAHWQLTSWDEHRDINEVMLATSLLPEGFLLLGAARYVD